MTIQTCSNVFACSITFNDAEVRPHRHDDGAFLLADRAIVEIPEQNARIAPMIVRDLQRRHLGAALRPRRTGAFLAQWVDGLLLLLAPATDEELESQGRLASMDDRQGWKHVRTLEIRLWHVETAWRRSDEADIRHVGQAA